jgi:hypothetical protein
MRWSLIKRSRYSDASTIFSLLYKGEVIDAKDPFDWIFKEANPVFSGTRNRRRSHRRRNGQKARQVH